MRFKLYRQLVLGELIGLVRIPEDAAFAFERERRRLLPRLYARRLPPERAAVALAKAQELTLLPYELGLCPYCADLLPSHRKGCALVGPGVARTPSLC